MKIDTPKSISTNGFTIAKQVKILNIFNNCGKNKRRCQSLTGRFIKLPEKQNS